jgi:transcriptional regulator with PAS, ATPase and Fis domain
MQRPGFERHGADRESSLGVYSPAMEQLVGVAARVAEVDSNVLIIGESGVGKERLARFIHDTSPRSNGPFVPVNCGALPDALFESELFGHVRGAFTGAISDRPGLFEAADKGTLLLDEVGEVPLPLQVKLLRALQEHEIRRVGENRQRKVTARVIAATNRDLAQDVRERRFRRDLFYRLNVVQLEIPPLRERPEDLRGLAASILVRVAGQMRRPITGYTPDAFEQILRYPWPGNIRELENAVERACVLATGELVDVADLPNEVRHHQSLVIASEHVRPLRDVEREYILAALERNNGNRTLTAEQLEIGPATLFRKLKRYGDGPWSLLLVTEVWARVVEFITSI